MMRSRLEEQIHVAVADLLRLQAKRGVIWAHIPNGGRMSVRTGARLKRMGVLPGIADFLLVFPPGVCGFLEIKAPKGVQSDAQKAFEALCSELSVPYAIARSSQQAEGILREWGALRGPVQSARAA